jgi:hypothetical protein
MKKKLHEEMVEGTFRDDLTNFNRVGKSKRKSKKTKRPMSSMLRKCAERLVLR